MVPADINPDDELLFADDTPEPSRKRQRVPQPWRMLVVDDEPDVHRVTRMVLADFSFEGRSLEIISALSGGEAREILRKANDIAVILLDVVMETDDAGLTLVREIRQDIGNENVRIVLRTGQPGMAPEQKVIVEYDINDYKSKAELTAQKLFTTIVAALRSYRDLVAIEIQLLRMSADPADRRLAIKHLRRPVRLLRKTIAHRHRRIVTGACELNRLRGIAQPVTIHPAAAMNERDDRQWLVAVAFLRQVDIDHLLRILIGRIWLIEPHLHLAAFRRVDDI